MEYGCGMIWACDPSLFGLGVEDSHIPTFGFYCVWYSFGTYIHYGTLAGRSGYGRCILGLSVAESNLGFLNGF